MIDTLLLLAQLLAFGEMHPLPESVRNPPPYACQVREYNEKGDPVITCFVVYPKKLEVLPDTFMFTCEKCDLGRGSLVWRFTEVDRPPSEASGGGATREDCEIMLRAYRRGAPADPVSDCYRLDRNDRIYVRQIKRWARIAKKPCP